MRLNSSFSKKIETQWFNQLDSQIRKFENTFACAGIQGDPENARKARGNHYGEFETEDGVTYSVPPRQFVFAATRDLGMGQYGEEIKKIIINGIREDRLSPHTQTTISQSKAQTDRFRRDTGIIRDTQFAMPGSGTHGRALTTDKFWERLSKKMAQNQRNAILSRNIIGNPNNAESTKRRKGFDHPLIDTREMLNSIKGWVG